ncbi:DHA2 family efflux MFS transporter permease subunit [Micromonospora sp. RP3T]|uniref:DHA2 family efflux MFS transporter permease subunit n=1 Tax=Micromonospora sp. RP3T TaxID=2135446 RepID=UPI001E523932|nr:DHA2 family efflux MFS transporter permease subunit [Micromonospora sp. RP3T]
MAATVLGSAMASIDATVVGIALPAIGREFEAGLATLQWVVIGYTLTLAGLLLVAGALGDRYGRRRVFVVGVVWFAVASLLCAVAPTAGMLVAMRALQGVGAALLTPGSLAILQAAFTPADRSRAIGAWSGLGGVATAVGPFVGGWLVAVGSWRLIFLINLPLAALVVAVALRHVPESRDRNAVGSIDATGGALVTVGLVGLTYGLIQGPSAGWTHPVVLASVVGGAAALAGFLAWEHRSATPMLPLGLFRSVRFSATNAITFIVYGALGGALFLLPIQLQQVSGYTPLQSGIALLPVTFIMLLLSGRSGALAARIGPRVQMSVGPVLVGVGLALLVRVGPGGTYAAQVLPAVIVFGLGLATTVAPLTATALDAAPAHQAGIASAVNNDVARAAGLIAVAVLPAAAGITGGEWQQPARFSAGFHTAVLICATLCLAGGLLAALTIRRTTGAAGAVPTTHLVHCALDTPPTAPVGRPSATGAGRRPGSRRW